MRQDWQSLLDGMLMSDGNLSIPGHCCFPRYQQTCNEPTFLGWVASWLPTPARISGPHHAGKYNYWLLSTRTDAIYSPIRERWYVQGKKQLPDDLQITPPVLLTEYLGDGYLLADAEKKAQRLELGTYGFERERLLGLMSKLVQVGLPFRLKANNALYLPGSQAGKFSATLAHVQYLPCHISGTPFPWKNAVGGRLFA